MNNTLNVQHPTESSTENRDMMYKKPLFLCRSIYTMCMFLWKLEVCLRGVFKKEGNPMDYLLFYHFYVIHSL